MSTYEQAQTNFSTMPNGYLYEVNTPWQDCAFVESGQGHGEQIIFLPLLPTPHAFKYEHIFSLHLTEL